MRCDGFSFFPFFPVLPFSFSFFPRGRRNREHQSNLAGLLATCPGSPTNVKDKEILGQMGPLPIQLYEDRADDAEDRADGRADVRGLRRRS